MSKGRGRGAARRPSEAPKGARELEPREDQMLFVLAMADALRDILRDETRALV